MRFVRKKELKQECSPVSLLSKSPNVYSPHPRHRLFWEVIILPWQREDEVRVQCYPSGSSLLLRIAGYVLIGAGVLVILLCVPCWAWLALVGAALILLGLMLVRK